jgi:DEAD/DEAH box helicase domain-containing protein
MDIVYFDLETQRTANDVGGWDRKQDMGMSLGVTYSTREGQYEIFGEAKADALIKRLQRADLVVGFNHVRFDYDVLMAYTILDLREALISFDILLDLEKILGHKIKLEDVAQATLGLGKTADGIDAIKWWREGRVLEIAKYCCFDVKVTRLVHEHGMAHGEVFFNDRSGRKQRVAVEWRR